jgi:putative cell wall-binding protein
VNESHFVLANGNSYADGLSAAALAGALDTDGAAMLLTDGNTLTLSTLTTMARMSGTINDGLKYVHLVGGTSAISAGIATQLTASGYVVTRIAGANRYATADAVAAEVKAQNGGNIGTFGGYRTAFLVNGNGYADAIAASAIAYDNKLPIYLTDGSTLSAATSASMVTNKIQKVIVLGGTAAIAEAVKTAALAVSTVVTTSRVSGADRYATAVALADTVAAVDVARKNKVVLVDGTNFPDGLAAGQYAASINATILLVNGATLPTTVSNWITGKQATLDEVVAVGGTSAVPAAAVTAAKTAGTKPAITATISKITDAGTSATVTFSQRVDKTDADTEANYVVTTKFGVAAAFTGTCTYTWTASVSSSVASCTGGTAMAPGSTFTVVGNAIVGYADALVKVATAAYTQAANTAAPTAVIHALAGTADAADKVWVTFNMVPSGFGNADITSVSQVAGGTASGVDTCNPFTTTVWACDLGAAAALVAGDQVKITAGSFTSGATTAVKSATAFTTIAVTDTVKPLLSSATFTTPVADTAAGSQAFLRVIGDGNAGKGAAGGGGLNGTVGDVTITALATGAYAGKAGNAVIVTVVADATVACTFSAATKTITVTAVAATMAPVVTDACNADATFSASFVAKTKAAITVFGMTNLVATTGTARQLQGGLNKSTVVLTFSEPLATFDIADVKVSTNCATACADTAVEAVVTTGSAEVNQEAAGVITLKVVDGGTLSAGLDKVTLAATTTDRNANVLLINGVSNVVLMQSAG